MGLSSDINQELDITTFINNSEILAYEVLLVKCIWKWQEDIELDQILYLLLELLFSKRQQI